MKELRYSTQFKKDIKRYAGNPGAIVELKKVLELIQNEIPIPSNYKPHKLVGQYVGCLECHIKNDLLLIWIDNIAGVAYIERFGTHSELFK